MVARSGTAQRGSERWFAVLLILHVVAAVAVEIVVTTGGAKKGALGAGVSNPGPAEQALGTPRGAGDRGPV